MLSTAKWRKLATPPTPWALYPAPTITTLRLVASRATATIEDPATTALSTHTSSALSTTKVVVSMVHVILVPKVVLVVPKVLTQRQGPGTSSSATEPPGDAGRETTCLLSTTADDWLKLHNVTQLLLLVWRHNPVLLGSEIQDPKPWDLLWKAISNPMMNT